MCFEEKTNYLKKEPSSEMANFYFNPLWCVYYQQRDTIFGALF